jgi:hypothetical protein
VTARSPMYWRYSLTSGTATPSASLTASAAPSSSSSTTSLSTTSSGFSSSSRAPLSTSGPCSSSFKAPLSALHLSGSCSSGTCAHFLVPAGGRTAGEAAFGFAFGLGLALPIFRLWIVFVCGLCIVDCCVCCCCDVNSCLLLSVDRAYVRTSALSLSRARISPNTPSTELPTATRACAATVGIYSTNTLGY